MQLYCKTFVITTAKSIFLTNNSIAIQACKRIVFFIVEQG